MIELTEEELSRLRTDTENNLVERKTVHDKDGWTRTAVAFANSTPIEMPAVLFIGVKDDGSFEPLNSDHDWEKQEKTVTRELNRAFPPLFFVYKTIRDSHGRQCLAVIVPGSRDRPHFAGKSYIRLGPETREASEGQFAALITERTSKAYEIRKWTGREVSVAWFSQGVLQPHRGKLFDCNHHYFTVQFESPGGPAPTSYPLNRSEISFNYSLNCLQIEVRDLP